MDILASIRLKSSGADQVARDFSKVKKSIKDVNDEAKKFPGVGAGGSGDPFEQATRRSDPGTRLPGRPPLNPPGDGPEERRRRHRDTPRGSGLSGFRTAVGTAESFAGGDIGGAAGNAMSGIGSMMGKGGIYAVAAGITIGALSKFFTKATDETEQMLNMGLAGRTGLHASKAIGAMKSSKKSLGLTESQLQSYLDAYTLSGGRSLSTEGSWLIQQGVNPSTVGKAFGLMKQTGSTYRREFDSDIFPSSLSLGQKTDFISSITSSVEGAIVQGFKRGSPELSNIWLQSAKEVSGYVNKGATLGSATAIQQKVRGTSYESYKLGRPEDAFSFMLARKPGESLNETRKRMRTAGHVDTVLQNLYDQSGGDLDLLYYMAIEMYGLNPDEVESFIKSRTPQLLAKEGKGTGKGIGKSISKKRTQSVVDPAIEAQKAKGRVESLTNELKESVVPLKTGVTNFLFDSGEGTRDLSKELSNPRSIVVPKNKKVTPPVKKEGSFILDDSVGDLASNTTVIELLKDISNKLESKTLIQTDGYNLDLTQVS